MTHPSESPAVLVPTVLCTFLAARVYPFAAVDASAVAAKPGKARKPGASSVLGARQQCAVLASKKGRRGGGARQYWGSDTCGPKPLGMSALQTAFWVLKEARGTHLVALGVR